MKNSNVVVKHAKTNIAFTTKELSDVACFVVMIDNKIHLISIWFLTYKAKIILVFIHIVEFLQRQVVIVFKFCHFTVLLIVFFVS